MTEQNQDRVMMNFRLPKEMRTKFRSECIQRDTTVTEVMYQLLKNQLTHWDRQTGVRP